VSQEEFVNAQHEAVLYYFCSPGNCLRMILPIADANLAAIADGEEQKDHGIQVSTEAAAAFAQRILSFQSRGEQGR